MAGLVNLYRIRQLYAHVRAAIKDRTRLASSRWWGELFTRAWQVQEVRESMGALIVGLQRYKSYIVAAAIGAVTVAYALGQIDRDAYEVLLGLLGSAGTATIAAKINRGQKV